MPFTGFSGKLPEYEVITPHTKKSYTVRSLTVQDEERMKGSFVTPAKVTDHLNRCIFEAIVKKPKEIKDFDSFLKMTTIKDREALLYGIYHITYDEARNYDVRCGNCRKAYSVTVQASSTFDYNPYPGDDILTKRLPIELPTLEGVIATIKQPTIYDEITAINSLSSTPGFKIENISETLIIDNITQNVEGKADSNVWDDRGDIIDAYKALPARDRRVIHDKWTKEFGEFGISLKMRSYCSHCGEEEVVDIDLVDQFFRAIHQ